MVTLTGSVTLKAGIIGGISRIRESVEQRARFVTLSSVRPGALEFDPEKIVPSRFVQDMSKISIETKYQKSQVSPLC